MATKYAAKGWVAKYAATATPTTTIDNLRSIRLKGGGRELIDATTHASATTKEYKPAPLRDTNEVVLEFLYDPADAIHELVRNHHDQGTTGYLTLVAPDAGAAQWAHSGVWTEWEITNQDPETGMMAVQATFRATGADTFTA